MAKADLIKNIMDSLEGINIKLYLSRVKTFNTARIAQMISRISLTDDIQSVTNAVATSAIGAHVSNIADEVMILREADALISSIEALLITPKEGANIDKDDTSWKMHLQLFGKLLKGRNEQNSDTLLFYFAHLYAACIYRVLVHIFGRPQAKELKLAKTVINTTVDDLLDLIDNASNHQRIFTAFCSAVGYFYAMLSIYNNISDDNTLSSMPMAKAVDEYLKTYFANDAKDFIELATKFKNSIYPAPVATSINNALKAYDNNMSEILNRF